MSWLHRWNIRRKVPQFLEACPTPFRGQVLEIGAGRGWTSQQILSSFPQVELTATDVDQSATERFSDLRDVYGRRLQLKPANVLKLPFDRESYDIVLAINVVSKLQTYAVVKALQEMIRVARPGGLIGIHNFSGENVNNKTLIETIEQTIDDENADTEFKKHRGGYMLWARKAYPIDPEDTH